jgi:hypothetical protein
MVASMTTERAKELLEQARRETEAEIERTRADSNGNIDDQSDASSDADAVLRRSDAPRSDSAPVRMGSRCKAANRSPTADSRLSRGLS